MLEALFGSTSPMWTAVPAAGFGLQQPVPVAGRPIATPFGSSPLSGMTGGLGNGPQTLPGPAFPLGTSTAAGINPFLTAQDVMPSVTASTLLAAVAVRRGQPQGPTNDSEVEEFLYDAFELLPGASDVEVRCEGGRVSLTGSVQHKRVKRDIGEIAWTLPALHDVQNNVTIASRRKSRGTRGETEATTPSPSRK
jgi:hypothetical protein